MIAIGIPYNPVLLLWTNMQYENLVQKSLIFLEISTILHFQAYQCLLDTYHAI